MATTGYGYDDNGRATLDAVFADALCAPAALVRPHFMNGTHAIACALYGALRAGDTLLCATDLPYDTLRPVISGDGCGSLKDYGVSFAVTPLCEPDGGYDAARHLDRLRADCGGFIPPPRCCSARAGIRCARLCPSRLSGARRGDRRKARRQSSSSTTATASLPKSANRTRPAAPISSAAL